MVALEILLFQITNKTYQTLPYLPNLSRTPFPNPSGGHQKPPSGDPILNFQHVAPDDLLKNYQNLIK